MVYIVASVLACKMLSEAAKLARTYGAGSDEIAYLIVMADCADGAMPKGGIDVAYVC
jgi:hypothetical protein